MKNPNVIRIDDLVKITNPQMFIRCGYPLSKAQVRDEIRSKYIAKIRELIGIANYNKDKKSIGWRDDDTINHCENKIIDALASKEMFDRDFGGNIRTIHTEYKSDYKDKFGRVKAIKFVKTGERVAGSRSYDSWSGGYEYDPPYLSHERTHKILELNFYTIDNVGQWEMQSLFQIEACNVEKIREGIYEENVI